MGNFNYLYICYDPKNVYIALWLMCVNVAKHNITSPPSTPCIATWFTASKSHPHPVIHVA